MPLEPVMTAPSAGRSSSTRLFEIQDLYRIPAWLLAKPLYALAPVGWHLRLASLRGRIESVVSPSRKAVLEELGRHLEGVDQRERRRIAREHFAFRRRNAVVRRWHSIRSFAGAEAVELEGIEHLDYALARGNGAILATAHFGYATLIKPILRLHGYDVLLVGRVDRWGALGPRLTRVGGFVHSRLRLPSSPRDEPNWTPDLEPSMNLRPHLAALAENKALILLVDGGATRGPVRLPVLGVETTFAPGAVSLGRTTGVPVLPAFAVHDPDARDAVGIRIVVCPPLELQTGDDARADNEVNLRRFARVYEQQIRSHPHNWHWSWVREGTFRNRHDTDTFVAPFRKFVLGAVPPGAVVLVASRGYEPLVELDRVTGRHFPAEAGFLPADGDDAIQQLETQRRLGATHIAFPAAELWWLDHYAGLREHLARNGTPRRGAAGVVYPIRASG